MSEQTLRDLMDDAVAEVTAIDVAQRAWFAAERRRTRTVVTALASAAVVVLVVGTAAVAGFENRALPGPPGTVSPSTTSGVTSTADVASDAVYQGVPVWWSPDLDQELRLPLVPPELAPLPAVIDVPSMLAEAADVMTAPVDRAAGAFALAQHGRSFAVLLVTRTGQTRKLHLTSLTPFEEEEGYAVNPAQPTMLSPDGRRLVFPQRDHLMVFTLSTGEWKRLDTGTAQTAYIRWLDDETLQLPQSEAGGPGPVFDLDGNQVGSAVLAPPAKDLDVSEPFDNPRGWSQSNGFGVAAQSWGMGPHLPVRDPARYLSGPAYLAVTGPDDTRVLAFMTGVDAVRWLDAPEVVGWLDRDTVVYESVAADRDLLVAWRVGTHDFWRVSNVRGGGVTSLADLSWN